MLEKTLRSTVFMLFLILVCITMTRSLNLAKEVVLQNEEVSKTLCLCIRYLYFPLNIRILKRYFYDLTFVYFVSLGNMRNNEQSPSKEVR